RVRSIEVLGEGGRGVGRSQSHTGRSDVDVEQGHSVRTVKVLEHALRVRNEFLNRVTRSALEVSELDSLRGWTVPHGTDSIRDSGPINILCHVRGRSAKKVSSHKGPF